MRLHIVAVLLAGALIICGLASGIPRNIAYYFYDVDDYIVYCRQTDLPHSDNGIGKEVRCGDIDIRKVLALCQDVDGITVCLSPETDVAEIVERLSVQVYLSQKLVDVYVFCGYSPLVKGGLYVDGQWINVQVAVTAQGVFVGSPLLLGSY